MCVRAGLYVSHKRSALTDRDCDSDGGTERQRERGGHRETYRDRDTYPTALSWQGFRV